MEDTKVFDGEGNYNGFFFGTDFAEVNRDLGKPAVPFFVLTLAACREGGEIG